MQKKVVITLPGIKAVSRNQTAGNFWRYHEQLTIAETWMYTYGKRHEYHFEKRVDIKITAYYDTRGRNKCADPANIDDKIFTDILIRYKKQGARGTKAQEKNVWFIQDDSPTFIRSITKEAIPTNEYGIVIEMTECE